MTLFALTMVIALAALGWEFVLEQPVMFWFLVMCLACDAGVLAAWNYRGDS